jgi:hypothetical protein
MMIIMTSNPLIAKYEEIYGQKEEPKKVGYELPKDFKEELKELRDTSTIPITKLTSYDNDSINDSFLQIAEKVKNKEAQVHTMNIYYEHQTGTQRIVFDVFANF